MGKNGWKMYGQKLRTAVDLSQSIFIR
eukprot:COSAG05_NODE_13921_length_414_cov_0.511111_1_plen_26_part_10